MSYSRLLRHFDYKGEQDSAAGRYQIVEVNKSCPFNTAQLLLYILAAESLMAVEVVSTVAKWLLMECTYWPRYRSSGAMVGGEVGGLG